MTTTVREQILETLTTKLTAATGLKFYRSRLPPSTRAEGTIGILKPVEEQEQFQAATRVLRTLLVEIVVIARSTSTQVADQVADATVAAAHAAIMADPTIGGLCGIIVGEGTKWEFEEADQTAVSVTMTYRIRYATAFKDLTVSA